MDNKREYWANAQTDDISKEVKKKLTDYRRWLVDSGYAYKMQTSYDAYYGDAKSGGRGIDTFADGKSRIQVNHQKNLLQRLHNLATQAKLNWQTRARNTDVSSQINADFAKGLLEFYNDEKGLHKVLTRSVEMALVVFEAFIYLPWNRSKGSVVRPDESGQIIRTGDQDFKILTAFDVARPTRPMTDPWYIIELPINKFDYAAMYPQYAEDILKSEPPMQNGIIQDYLVSAYSDLENRYDEDMTTLQILIHPRTPALPDGRETWIVADQVIKDEPLTYQIVPIVRLSAGDIISEVTGDSPGSSTVSLQDGLDRLFSAVVTNNINGAVSNIYSRDPNIEITSLNEGQRLIKASEKPEALSLVNSPKETYNLIDLMVNHMQLLSGVNATARGNPEDAVSTAGGQALMLAQAIQFVSDLQANFARAASEVGTIIINNLQTFATEPMLAYIGGNSRKAYIKTFQSEDVQDIDRVSVDLGDPMTQTIAGRWQLVQEWTQMGLIKDPTAVVEFLRTGQVDSLTEDKFKDMTLIREENEALKRGEQPPVMITDNHIEHILQHKEILTDPDARSDPKVVQEVTNHLQTHIETYKGMDMDLAAILQMPPLPSMQQPQAPAPGQEGPVEVQGTNMPPMPEGTPPETQADYEQVTDNMATNPAAQEPAL